MSRFRFESLGIWQRAADLGLRLFRLADHLDSHNKYRFAEHAAALSISNNIAEGSGSDSNRDIARFVSIARKSTCECASMTMIFERAGYVSPERTAELLDELQQLSRMQSSFHKNLRSDP